MQCTPNRRGEGSKRTLLMRLGPHGYRLNVAAHRLGASLKSPLLPQSPNQRPCSVVVPKRTPESPSRPKTARLASLYSVIFLLENGARIRQSQSSMVLQFSGAVNRIVVWFSLTGCVGLHPHTASDTQTYPRRTAGHSPQPFSSLSNTGPAPATLT